MTSPSPLPNVTWTDPAAVTSYLTSLASTVVAVIVAAHPGFSEPTLVQALIPAIGFVVAGVAQIVNVATHRQAQIATIKAQPPVPAPVAPAPSAVAKKAAK